MLKGHILLYYSAVSDNELCITEVEVFPENIESIEDIKDFKDHKDFNKELDAIYLSFEDTTSSSQLPKPDHVDNSGIFIN